MLRLGAVARGLGDEVRAMHAVARSVPLDTWFAFTVWYLLLASVGLLPLGPFALALHVLTWAILALVLVAPGVVARLWRIDDELGVRGRSDPTVVGHLPDVIALFAFPFYMLSQAVLFWRLERQFPGSLAGDGWGMAWRYALDNLLLTELFLDVFDVFRLTLASDATSLLGAVAVFTTRAMLSLGFIRVALRVLRAALYRASGVGRGVDHLALLHDAVEDDDVAGARLHARAIAAGMHDTVVLLAERVDDPARTADAWRSLHAIRDWAIPYLRVEAADGHPRGERFRAIVERLDDEDVEPPALADPSPRPLLRAVLVVTIIAALAVPLVVVGPWGVALATALTVAAACALASPRALLEAAVEHGVVPVFPVERFRHATVAWVGATTVVFLVAGYGLIVNVASVAPHAFAPRGAVGAPSAAAVGQVVDARAASGFVVANLARVQVFFGAADVFAIAPLPLEQRPLAGSLVTLALRTGVNLGLVALVLTLLSVGGERLGLGALGVNHVLIAALEARRGGRYAADLLEAHDLEVAKGLMTVLDQAEHGDLRMALAASGAYEWCAFHESAGAWAVLEAHDDACRVRSQAAIAEALSRRGGRAGIAPLVDEVATAFAPHDGESLVQLVPWTAVEVWCHLAAVDGEQGRYREAWHTLERASAVLTARGIPDELVEAYGHDETHLVEPAPAPDDVERAWREAELIWVRVAASIAIAAAQRDEAVPSAALLLEARTRLAPLAEADPLRSHGDALLLDGIAAAWEGAEAAVATLERVVDALDELPTTHPAHAAIGAVARLVGDVVEERCGDARRDVRARLAAVDARAPGAGSFDPLHFDELVGVASLLVRLAPGPAALAGSHRALAVAEAHAGALTPTQRSALAQMLTDAVFAARDLERHEDVVSLGRALRRRIEAAAAYRGGTDRFVQGVLASAEAHAAEALGDTAAALEAGTAAHDAFLTLSTDGAAAIDEANLTSHTAAIDALLRRVGDPGGGRPNA
ncbi:MAG: hypothetical protein EA416_02890 [Trueperaceae bacterium]|nr:MAG: hypothetical protein EA416_02890 [Trueperaceae bacterium]